MHVKLVSVLFLKWLKAECLREIQDYYLNAGAFINKTSHLNLKSYQYIFLYDLLSINLLFAITSTIRLKLRSFICSSGVLLWSLSEQQGWLFVFAATGAASILFQVAVT